MPLVRFEVRSEYGLGDPELYKGTSKKEDSKALLDGVAVAGFVGILRQLGDLAEFASDVFHDLHEQVIATAARGRKVLNQAQNFEAALPSIEKAFQGQTSHIHLAYVAGSDWHARLSTEKNHLLSNDWPRYMMDSYEQCRNLPRLYLLDKFDRAGAGACLNRYSDCSYFRKMANMSRMEMDDNIRREQKSQKHKKRGSRLRNGELCHALSASGLRNGEFEHVPSTTLQNSRWFESPSIDGQRLSEHRSPNMRSNPELPSRSTSFGSKTRLSFVEQVTDANHSAAPDEIGYPRFSDVKSTSVLHDEISGNDSNDGSKHESLEGQSVPKSPPSITWVEKTEIVMLPSPVSCDDTVVDMVEDSGPTNLLSLTSTNYGKLENLDQQRISLNSATVSVSSNSLPNPDDVTSEMDNYMDALNTVESETETEAERQTKTRVKSIPDLGTQGIQPVTAMMQALIVQHCEVPDAEPLNTSHTPPNQHESPLSLDEVVPSQDLCSSALNEVSKENAPDDSRKDSDNSSVFNPPFKCTISDVQTMVGDETVVKEPTALCSPPLDSMNTSSVPSTKPWTNAGLFGFEPSKPADLGSLNVVEEGMTYGSNESNNSSGMENVNISHARVCSLIWPNDPSSCPSSLCSSQHDDVHGKPNLLSKFDILQVKPANDIHADLNGIDMEKNNPQAEIEPTTTDPGQSTANFSSSFSSLAQRFLANTLQRKASISYSDSFSPSQAVTSDARISNRSFSLVNCNVAPHGLVSLESPQQRKEDGPHGSSKLSDCSGQSSPLLEYMKIYFHSLNVSGTFKLNLEFSDGNLHESANDLILPGAALPLPDSASESDDDTFCKSYNYSSEDLLTPHLYSNDLWDQDERVFEEREISPSASVSGYRAFDQGKTSGMNRDHGFTEPGMESMEVPFESFAAVNLPALDSLITLKHQEIGDYNSHDRFSLPLENQTLMPPPPPLPPMQWRMTKSSTSEHKSTKSKDSVVPTNGVQPLCFAQQQGQMPIPPSVHGSLLAVNLNKVEMPDRNKETHYASYGKEMTVREALPQRTGNKPDQQKTCGQEKARKDAIDTETFDEREDLLHQIRNKSFNFRTHYQVEVGLGIRDDNQLQCNRNLGEGKHNTPGICW